MILQHDEQQHLPYRSAILWKGFDLEHDRQNVGEDARSFPTLPATQDQNSSPMYAVVIDEDGKCKRYSCLKCGVASKRKFDMERHIRCVHEKVRKHRCSDCPRAFFYRCHLNDHIRASHAETSVYMCTGCNKRFGGLSKLKRHVLTVHENVRSFPCLYCEKAYKDKKALNHHHRKEHNHQTEDKIPPHTTPHQTNLSP